MTTYRTAFTSIAVALSMVASALAAPVSSVPYDLRHDFNIRLIGNQVYRGAWQWFDHAIAESKAAPRDDKTGQGNAPFTPPSTDTKTTTATSGTATANANSQYLATAGGSGYARVFGGGNLGANGTYVASEAATTVGLNRGVRDRRTGAITWKPEWTYITARTGRLGDPIDVSFLNLDDGTTTSSRLFELDMNFAAGGSSTYTNGDVTISGRTGRFSLVMDSPNLTTGTGIIEIDFLDGLITQSFGTGIFSALVLPALGSDSSAIGFHLGDASGAFNLGFDFGSVPGNISGYDFQAQFGNSAFVEAAAPEPATLALTATACALLWIRRRRNHAQ